MAQKIKLDWQKDFIALVNKMDNSELLEETIYAAQGDSYDGEFTSRGEWQLAYLKRELQKRLGKWLERPISGRTFKDD